MRKKVEKTSYFWYNEINICCRVAWHILIQIYSRVRHKSFLGKGSTEMR